MKTKLINYIKAAYAGLYVVSHEEGRIEAIVREVTDNLNKIVKDAPPFQLHAWSVTEGIMDTANGHKIDNTEEPLGMLDAFIKMPPRTILLARDFHFFAEDRNPVIWRRIKDALAVGKSNNKVLIIVGCRQVMPPELEKELTVVEFTLPDKDQLKQVLRGVLEGNGKKLESVQNLPLVLAAASGLTTIEAENAFALSIIEKGGVDPDVIYREKCQIVKKNGLLEVVETKLTLDDIGGLQALKQWVLERKDAFSDEARSFHLPQPKGFMAVGQPGTGKSLTAKALRAVLGVPLMRLDAGKLFGSLVGQSEANWRAVHATAKAMTPCIVWVDEVDGLFSGNASSGKTDGGTTSRVIKSILQDMQENSEGIFYVFTANDVDNIPSPVLRRRAGSPKGANRPARA